MTNKNIGALQAPRIQTPKQAEAFILEQIEGMRDKRLARLASMPLETKEFKTWPGSVKHHHKSQGGLILHTAQVLDGALLLAQALESYRHDELVTAAVWHDLGKVWDYRPAYNALEYKDGEIERHPVAWEYDKHKELIGHLSRSAMDFRSAATWCQLPDDQMLIILHMILSHHGRREWGSPVEPQTSEAWCLHAADMLSSHFSTDSVTGPNGTGRH